MNDLAIENRCITKYVYRVINKMINCMVAVEKLRNYPKNVLPKMCPPIHEMLKAL